MDLEMIRSYIRDTQNDWNYTTPLEFYNLYYLKKNKDYILIDLRKPEDYQKFHIEGSINIFWLDLFEDSNIKKLPRDKKIFLICYVGHTSSQVMTLLKLLGYDVTSIKYGYGISPTSAVPVAGWLNYNLPTTSSPPNQTNNIQSGGSTAPYPKKRSTKAKRSKTKRSKTKCSKTKRSKTKCSKTKRSKKIC